MNSFQLNCTVIDRYQILWMLSYIQSSRIFNFNMRLSWRWERSMLFRNQILTSKSEYYFDLSVNFSAIPWAASNTMQPRRYFRILGEKHHSWICQSGHGDQCIVLFSSFHQADVLIVVAGLETIESQDRPNLNLLPSDVSRLVTSPVIIGAQLELNWPHVDHFVGALDGHLPRFGIHVRVGK